MLRRTSLAYLLPLTLLSCTQYEFYGQLDYVQASYSNEVDILFITDNSESMKEEQQALSVNFSRFMNDLVEAQATEEALPHQTLTDAVVASIYYVGNFNRFIDYQVAMTTTEIVDAPTSGQSGTFVLDAVLTPQTEDIETEFAGLVDWVKYHVATLGDERGLDAMRMAVCRGLEDPGVYDQTQRDDLKVGCCDVAPSDYGTTSGLFRPGAPLAVVIVSDEGDFSDLTYHPTLCDTSAADPSEVETVTVDDYLSFFEAAGLRVVVSVIGPTIPDDTGEGVLCNPASSPFNRINRYADLVQQTGGILEPICDPNNPLSPNPNFANALEDIGLLISTLQNRFELERAPDVESILVIVDDHLIAEDPTNGWAYVKNEGRHFVEFRGDAVPSYDANVEVYYRPAAGDDPRVLPF